MNELYFYRNLINKPSISLIKRSLPVSKPNKDGQSTYYRRIVDRIKEKQQGTRGLQPSDILCKQCRKVISSEWNPTDKKWQFINYNNETKCCSRCDHINDIRINTEKYLKKAGVPIKYLACSFANFQVYRGNRSNVDFCYNYTLKEYFDKGLYLYGPCGTGKTHLAVSILRENILKGNQGLFTSMPDLFLKIRRAFSNGANKHETEEYYLKEYATHPFLVLDDFGIEKTTEWNRQIVNYIISERDNNLSPVIITTNLSLMEIAQKIDERTASRLADMTDVIYFNGTDYRKRKNNE